MYSSRRGQVQPLWASSFCNPAEAVDALASLGLALRQGGRGLRRHM